MREKCDDPKKLNNFSKHLKKCQTHFLSELIQNAAADEHFKNKDGKLQIEILLWGGDEIEMVVPAWKGWETISLFYSTMKDAEYDNMPLTHAGGIVFCHHNAPILNIRKLAHDLADKVKNTVPKDIKDILHDKHDVFRSIVLKSFDNIGGDLSSFTERYYKGVDLGDLIMTASEMNEFHALVNDMKKGFFPRNKLHEMARIISQGDDASVKALLESALTSVDNDYRDTLKEKLESLNTRNGRWYLLAELWDYIGGEV